MAWRVQHYAKCGEERTYCGLRRQTRREYGEVVDRTRRKCRNCARSTRAGLAFYALDEQGRLVGDCEGRHETLRAGYFDGRFVHVTGSLIWESPREASA